MSPIESPSSQAICTCCLLSPAYLTQPRPAALEALLNINRRSTLSRSSQTSSKSSPRALVQQYLVAFGSGDINWSTLVRALTLYPGWQTPTSDLGEPLLLPTTQGPALLLFLDADRARTYLSTERVTTHAVHAISGDLFASIGGPETRVCIEPESPYELQIGGDRLASVPQLAQAAIIEAMLVDGRPVEMAMLRDWPHWLGLFTEETDGRLQLALTADREGRPLAAVFTAEDCLQAFEALLPPDQRQKTRIREVKGAQFFSQLLYLPLAGVAFNPAGPVPSRAFDKQWVERLVRAVPELN